MILVTGGTGFLGSVLIKQLLDQGVFVRAIKRVQSQVPASLVDRDHLEWIDADILDFLALEEAFRGVSQVYHCAATVSYDPKLTKSMHRTNVEGTAHIVNLAKQHGARLVHVSSIAALGEARNGGDTTERDLWEYRRSHSAYAMSKYESEMEVWRGIAEGLQAVIVNPSLIIGPGAGKRGSGQIFHLLYKGLRFYPGGTVGLVDVDDVAKAMILLMEKAGLSGERYIINNVNMTHYALLQAASRFMNRPAPRVRVSSIMLETAWRLAALRALLTGKNATLTKDSARIASKRLRYSNDKIRALLGFEFKPIEQTLQAISDRVLDHYRAGNQ